MDLFNLFNPFLQGLSQYSAYNQAAAMSQRETAFNVGQLREQREQMRGQSLTNAAASGLDTSVGAPVAALSQQRYEDELDAAMIAYRGDVERYSYSMQGHSSLFAGIGETLSGFQKMRTNRTRSSKTAQLPYRTSY